VPVKYLGSKRRLVPALNEVARLVRADSAIDLFTGSTRVATAWRANGLTVTAVDRLRFVHAAARTYLATPLTVGRREVLVDAIAALNRLDGTDGYITETFCRQARFFTPENGARADAVRAAIADRHNGTWREPILITALLEAADRVDSTTGLQMAYLKQWAPRAATRLTLRLPEIPDGPVGRAVLGDATRVASRLAPATLAYLDPPYNQHRYESNYHVWETICRGDAPEAYGVARKRVDLRDDPASRSVFNDRRALPGALRTCIEQVRASIVVVSCSNEGWLGVDEVVALCESRGRPLVVAFDSPRYVGARIGIHDPRGAKVGTISHVRNTEYLVVAGELSRSQRRDLARLALPPVACA
jgi:adenine-specific DNA-methyltransferase